jgi:tyrosine decarboxylase/aspartate 1-decarboxylase
VEERGQSAEEIFCLLRKARERDEHYEEGRILGSMCTSPHPLALRAYRLFLEANLGDAGLFPGTRDLEREAVRCLGALLGNPEAPGFIVSGGTEANLTALWVARNRAGIREGEIIASESIHFSIEKAADLLRLRLRKAPLREDHRVDVEAIRERIGEQTVALVGVAGSTEYGTVDEIPALSEMAVEAGIHLHVDAAFGGFVLPFLPELNLGEWPFDFSLSGVSSITIDPHKMGLAPLGCGGILFREESLLKPIETQAPYLTERRQYTITGTRGGYPAAAVFTALKALGREGYRSIVRECMENTLFLYRGLKALGLQVFEPTLNLLVFGHEAQEEMAAGLEERGWRISRTRKGEIRLVLMPHVKRENLSAFLGDVKELLTELDVRS